MAETPEAIAYQLLRCVAHAEKKQIEPNSYGTPTDREWILQAYSDCLYAVKNPNLKQGLNDS